MHVPILLTTNTSGMELPRMERNVGSKNGDSTDPTAQLLKVKKRRLFRMPSAALQARHGVTLHTSY